MTLIFVAQDPILIICKIRALVSGQILKRAVLDDLLLWSAMLVSL
ncbi:unnamed protein product [Acidithrix sp. C25]|nr:unnamed protein product [Acidithrix sp. C25]